MEEIHAIVTGRVQGVGFRATVKYHASQMKLVGFARNLPDGSVEICAQGEKKILEKLISELKEEFGSYIDKIQIRFQAISESYSNFRIL
jgi:acylphosphatase